MSNGFVTTPAEATCTALGGAGGDGSGERWWRVIVRTAPFWAGPKHRCVYVLKAYTEDRAASKGLRRFAEEIDQRPPLIVEP